MESERSFSTLLMRFRMEIARTYWLFHAIQKTTDPIDRAGLEREFDVAQRDKEEALCELQRLTRNGDA